MAGTSPLWECLSMSDAPQRPSDLGRPPQGSGEPTLTHLPDSSGNGTPESRTVAPPPMPAQVARFEVRRFVGEGAFGRVYEAFDPALKRTVALKVAKAEQVASPQKVERFLREARARRKNG